MFKIGLKYDAKCCCFLAVMEERHLTLEYESVISMTQKCMYRYQKTDEDDDISCSDKASSLETIKDVLMQIFNFKRLKSPTILSGGIVAWEVLIFCKYKRKQYCALVSQPIVKQRCAHNVQLENVIIQIIFVIRNIFFNVFWTVHHSINLYQSPT